MRTLFEVHNNWEIDNPFYSVMSDPETRRYPLVELTGNSNIFLVDAEIESEGGGTLICRYILGSALDAINLLDQANIKDGTISLLSRRFDKDSDYEVSDLIEIITAKDKSGQTSYILCCKNGKRYIDPPFGLREEDLSECKTIYGRSLTK